MESERRLSPDEPLWRWAYAALTQRAGTMLSHLEGVRLGEDIEAVHDMRVWSRRLAAAMRVFAPCFPDADYAALLREARQVTRRLGAVRDLDVLIDHYERLEPADEAEGLGIAYLQALRQRERDRARRPMLAALARFERSDFSGRLARYLKDEAAAYTFGFTPQAVRGMRHDAAVTGTMAFRSAAPVLLSERHAELYSFEAFVASPQAETELHAMRIAAKWLRYTMELFSPAYADRLKRELTIVQRFQELLGDLHDADVRRELLRSSLSRPLEAPGLEALGLMLPEPVIPGLKALAAREDRERQVTYEIFYNEWSKRARRDFKRACLKRLRSPDAEA